MKIRDVANAVGCSVRALRHYHESGALPEPQRDSSGYRNYSLDDLANAFRVRAFVQAGVPLSEINTGNQAYKTAHTLLNEKIAELEEQKSRLELLMSGRNGVPHAIAEIFDTLQAEYPDISELLKAEINLIGLLALSQMTSEKTWVLIEKNLHNPECLQATITGLRIWKSLATCHSENAPEIDELVALTGQGYMSDVMHTLKPGKMPIEIVDASTSLAQAEALRRLQ